jgi:hypothetical protein
MANLYKGEEKKLFIPNQHDIKEKSEYKKEENEDDKPKFAGGRFFVYEDTKLNDLLGKKVVGVFTHPVSHLLLEGGIKVAIFGTDTEIHVWEEKNEKK